jgi:hypothetical protein
LGCSINQRRIPYISICWFRVIKAIFCVHRVFIAEKVDGVGKMGVRKYQNS